MKRAKTHIAPHFNASRMGSLRPFTGDAIYEGVVVLVNRLISPYEGLTLTVVDNAVHEIENGHHVTITLGGRDHVTPMLDVHGPVMECYRACDVVPKRVDVVFEVGDQPADDTLRVSVYPCTMVEETTKKPRLQRTKSWRDKLSSLWKAAPKTDAPIDPHATITSHLVVMNQWVEDRALGGSHQVPVGVAKRVASHVCAALRSCDTTWQIESLGVLARESPEIPNGWLMTRKPCVSVDVGVQDGQPLPVFDAMVVDRAMSMLKETNITTRIITRIRNERDGLRFLVAIM